MPLVKKPNFGQQRRDTPNAIYTALRKEILNPAANDYRSVQEGWSNESRSTFKVRFDGTRLNIIGLVIESGGNAEEARVTVWHLLNFGTDVRYMQVSKDWKSKTEVRSLSSGPGAGRTTGLGPPREGIDERLWTVVVQEKYRPKERDVIRKAISGVVRR